MSWKPNVTQKTILKTMAGVTKACLNGDGFSTLNGYLDNMRLFLDMLEREEPTITQILGGGDESRTKSEI